VAADLLSASADAIVAGDLALARDRLRQADMQALFDFARRLMGPEDKDIHRRRPVPKSASVVSKMAARMPNSSQIKALYLRDGWRCRFCGCRVVSNRARDAMRACLPGAIPWGEVEGFHGAFFSMTASVDHVRPHSAGGDNSAENLVTACWSCQFGRGAYTLEELGLSDPRGRPPIVDDWDGLCRVLGRGTGNSSQYDNETAAASQIHERGRQAPQSSDVQGVPHPAGARARTKPSHLSEAKYFDLLENMDPGAAAPFKTFLESLADTGVAPEYQQSVVLRFALPSGAAASAGWVRTDGTVYVADAHYFAEKVGRREIGQRYLDAVAAIAGGTVRRYEKGHPEVFEREGGSLRVSLLLRDAAGWRGLIATFINELRTATTA
jgi:hypothetical protein